MLKWPYNPPFLFLFLHGFIGLRTDLVYIRVLQDNPIQICPIILSCSSELLSTTPNICIFHGGSQDAIPYIPPGLRFFPAHGFSRFTTKGLCGRLKSWTCYYEPRTACLRGHDYIWKEVIWFWPSRQQVRIFPYIKIHTSWGKDGID